tara:strand:+ start:128 stop:451 length:324 start_codon:yes stop_codon:yes gene_type:complete
MAYQQQISDTFAARLGICQGCEHYQQAFKRCHFDGNWAEWRQSAPWEECPNENWTAEEYPGEQVKEAYKAEYLSAAAVLSHEQLNGVATPDEFYPAGEVLGNGYVCN